MAKNRKVKQPISVSTEDNLVYEGDVVIKIVDSNKRVLSTQHIKNHGTKLLFQGIALYLSHNYTNSFLPYYMGIGTSNEVISDINELNLGSEIENKRVLLQTHNPEFDYATVGTDRILKGYKIRYSATFPYSLIQTSSIQEFGLFSSKYDNGTMIARITTTSPVKIPTSGMSLVVE